MSKQDKPIKQKGIAAMKIRKVLEKAPKEGLWIKEICRRSGLNPSSVYWAIRHTLKDEIEKAMEIESAGRPILIFYKLREKSD
ncbi:hypothetical protein ACFL6S_03510 [Candidatus Poribacteria bacterium]